MTKDLVELLTFSAGLSYQRMIIALLVSTAISIYIFFIYRVITKSSFYSKSYNLTMSVMAVITTAIIVAMQSSLVVSLGMVGALSIVRFRTAIKDPMDLLFLFWSIGIGIITGTELYLLGVILSIVVTLLLLTLDFIPVKKAPFLLVLNSTNKNIEEDVTKIVEKYSKTHEIKSRNINKRGLDMIVELRTSEPSMLVKEMTDNIDVENVSLLSHDGETRF